LNDLGSFAIFGTERVRLTVAIRAEHPQIFQPMIVPDAVAVIDLDG